jgi:hypothetical protein
MPVPRASGGSLGDGMSCRLPLLPVKANLIVLLFGLRNRRSKYVLGQHIDLRCAGFDGLISEPLFPLVRTKWVRNLVGSPGFDRPERRYLKC